MPKPYTPHDKWSRKAEEEGYRARSVYKLRELDERMKLLKSGMTVLDCGAAPGSWLQYAAERVGPKGLVIGVDLQEIDPPAAHVKTFVADVLDLESIKECIQDAGATNLDLVLSDLAPSTSGIRDVDQWRSIELSQSVANLARAILPPNGRCVLKVLRGEDFDEFLRGLKKQWRDVKNARVKATRDRSTEIYLILTK